STWPDNIRRRARHVTTEMLRVHAAAAALRQGDFVELGRLISEAHVSLDRDYEVSSAELNLMVALAKQIPGLFGARMTGAGFGGCTINLVQPKDAGEFAAKLAKSYEEEMRVKPDVYACRASDGVEELT
ncbi:MAG: galactokinase, partial [Candidatus Acidiferrales bacterium]